MRGSLGEMLAFGTGLMAMVVAVSALRSWIAWRLGKGPRPWPPGGSDGGGDASDGGGGD